jgi:hypothetical protein
MARIISFHAVSLEFFDETIEPLTVGGKINPESFVDDATRLRRTDWQVKGYKLRLSQLLEDLVPPPPPTEGGVWHKLRARLEQLDFKPDPTAKRIEGKVDPDIHLWGRPYLIFENSADRVSMFIDDYGDAAGEPAVESLILEQLVRLDPKLPTELEPVELREPDADLTYRNELLDGLKSVHGIARDLEPGSAPNTLLTTRDTTGSRLGTELPWRSVWLHSRTHPFWIGRNIDGLASVCQSAGVEPPSVLVPCWRLFAGAIERFPELRELLTPDLEQERDVGGFVAPSDIGELNAYLNQNGSRIIQAATREGVGPLCATMLKKVRECTHHAQRLGRGYLEASGILPVSYDPEDFEDDDGEAYA